MGLEILLYGLENPWRRMCQFRKTFDRSSREHLGKVDALILHDGDKSAGGLLMIYLGVIKLG